MKKIFLLLTLLVSLKGFAQNFPKETDVEQMIFVKVTEVPNATEDKIYQRVKLAIADMYNSAKNVTQADDAENKTVIIKALFKNHYTVTLHSCPGYTNYSMRVDVKDGKFRAVVYDMMHNSREQGCGSGGSLANEKPACGTFQLPKNQWSKLKEQAQGEAKLILAELNKKVLDEKAGSTNNDW